MKYFLNDNNASNRIYSGRVLIKLYRIPVISSDSDCFFSTSVCLFTLGYPIIAVAKNIFFYGYARQPCFKLGC